MKRSIIYINYFRTTFETYTRSSFPVLQKLPSQLAISSFHCTNFEEFWKRGRNAGARDTAADNFQTNN